MLCDCKLFFEARIRKLWALPNIYYAGIVIREEKVEAGEVTSKQNFINKCFTYIS